MSSLFPRRTWVLTMALGLLTLPGALNSQAEETAPGWPGTGWSVTDVPALGEGWFEIMSSGARYSVDDGSYLGGVGETVWESLWVGDPPDYWPAPEQTYTAFTLLFSGGGGYCTSYCAGDVGLETNLSSDYPWDMYWWDDTGQVTIPYDNYDPLTHDPLGSACMRNVWFVSSTQSCVTSRWHQRLWVFGDMEFGDMEAASSWYNLDADDCDYWYANTDLATSIFYEAGAAGSFVDSVLGLPIAKVAYYDPLCTVEGEDCTNGIDDDGDGGTDCDDCECTCDGSCPNECDSCYDGIDNDGDGDTDCNDTDCQYADPDCSAAVEADGINGYVAGWMYVWPFATGVGDTIVEILDEDIDTYVTCDDERCGCSLLNIDIEDTDAQRWKDRLRVYPETYELKVFYGITHGTDAAETFPGDTTTVLTNDFNMVWQPPADVPSPISFRLVGVGGTPPCLQCLEHRWDWGMWAYEGLDEFCASDVATAAPDALCHRFHVVDSNDPSGAVSYNFEDISPTGTATGLGRNDDLVLTVPFSFLFDGNLVSDIVIGANGGILVDETTGQVKANNCELPCNVCAVGPDDRFIGGLWDALDPDLGGEIYYETLGAVGDRRFIIQWDGVPHKNDATAAFTFQIVLYENEEIFDVQYQTVSLGTASYAYGRSATVGMQTAHVGGQATDYCYTTECPSYLEDGLAIRFYH